MTPVNTAGNLPPVIPPAEPTVEKKDLFEEAPLEGHEPVADATPSEPRAELTQEERAQFEKLLESLEAQMEREQAARGDEAPVEEDDFEIPPGLELYFKAPLNRALLERDYAIWKRLIKISGFIFTQSALQFQGISKSSMVLGSVMGIFFSKYLPITFGGGLGLYSAYKAVANLSSIVLGKESLQDRSDLWNSASEQRSSYAALTRRALAVIGTSSFTERLTAGFWGAVQTYGAYVGADLVFGRNNPWTTHVVSVIKAAEAAILPNLGYLAAGGISYFGMMSAWSMNGEGVRKLQGEFEGFGEDMSYSGELDRLLYISDQEYRADLTKAMEIAHYDQLKTLRSYYKEKIDKQIEARKYPAKDQIQINPTEELRELNPENPENALKPALAQLIVLQKQKEPLLQTYSALIEKNQLAEAQKVLDQSLKPMLYKIEFLKQTIIDPARPAMGVIAHDGSSYYSYVSLLAGTEIKWDLKATAPELVTQEAHELFLNEAAIQKIIYHQQGKEYVMQMQQQRGLRA